MLELKNISKSFSNKQVLNHFSLKIAEHEKVCIMGPSGCGKTTLLRIACNLLSPDSGEIINTFKKESFIFQENRLLPWYDAIHNITCLGIENSVAKKYLDMVGLGAEACSYPSELSGGMARRLAIARALSFGVDIFYIDEAFYGLDHLTKQEILGIFKTELKQKAALIITHDTDVANELADRIIKIS